MREKGYGGHNQGRCSSANWESHDDAASLTDAQRAELDYRITRHEQNPSDVIPWEQVRASLFKKPIVVTNCGRICLGNKKINFSTVFAGQAVGIKEVQDGIWLVSFMDYDLGYFDLETRVLEPLDNPFGPRLLAM
jgi:putative transposase